MFRARAGARRNRSVYARLYRLCRGGRGEIASATGDVAPAAARFAKDGWFGLRRRAVKLAKQRENSVSLRDPCAWTACAGCRSDRRPACAVGCVGGCTNITQIVAETTHLPQALGLAAPGHARILGRPAYGRPCRLAGGRASDCATGGASASAGIGGSAAAVPSGLCLPAPPRRGAIHFSQPRSLAGHTCALHGFAGGSANRIADGEDCGMSISAPTPTTIPTASTPTTPRAKSDIAPAGFAPVPV